MRLCVKRLLAACLLLKGIDGMAVEEAKYTVALQDGAFELRDYAAQVLAVTVVQGGLEEAGNRAFGRLFRYISGENRARREIAMTAPVAQEAAGRKIAMTAPVGQEREGDRWSVSFMMPASFTLETLPEPADPAVTLRAVPARRMAVVRYSGRWSEAAFLKHKAELDDWISRRGLTVAGEPVWARYNPPFTLWFLRRNEILIPVAGGSP